MANLPISFYWYDYETFGRHPALDRPSQFAGIRTNLDLEPIGAPLEIFNRPTDDYLPDPEACRVTGVAPQDIARRGLAENVFIKKILAELSYPGTCNVGYNNIRFDDEFTRFTLFRNFFDPYEHEWKNGNSRWDLIDVVRLTRALRPDGISWPFHADGSPSNRLEDIASINGLEHANAHDALSDVEVTIAVARLIKQSQPRLYDYVFTHRDKTSVASLLNVREQNAVVHVSGMVPSLHGNTAIVAPLAPHPTNRNGIIVLDLRHDPAELADLDADTIRARIFTPARLRIPGESRLAVKTVHINKSPVLVPLTTLDDASAERLGIDKRASQSHLESLKKHPQIIPTIIEALQGQTFQDPEDVDATLYSGGFFSPEQKDRFATIREADAEGLRALGDSFDDNRCNEMLFRYRGRNFPESLNQEEQERWLEHCQDKVLNEHGEGSSRLAAFRAALEQDWPEDQHALGESLKNWADSLEARLRTG